MDIVERLRQIDFTFWYSPVGPDEKFEPIEIGKMSHEAADEIERLREALKSISKIPNSESAYGIIQTFVDDALKGKE